MTEYRERELTESTRNSAVVFVKFFLTRVVNWLCHTILRDFMPDVSVGSLEPSLLSLPSRARVQLASQWQDSCWIKMT